MDRLANYRKNLERVLTEQTVVPYAYGDIRFQLLFDHERDHYLVMLVGTDHAVKRVYGPLVHVDIIDGKFSIQRDGTEYGIARELMDAGVTPEDIVLAWRASGPMSAIEALAA